MATFKSICNIFLVFLAFLNVAISLYEDQIGKFDWKQSYIGNIKYGSFDSVKRVIVATDENVLASLHLKNGEIAWRQILENPSTNQIELLSVDKEVVTVSGCDTTWYVRGWDVNLGALLWEWTLYPEKSAKGYWILSKDQLIHIVPVVGSHLEVTTYEARTGRNSGKTLKISTPWVTDLSRCITTGVYWTCISSDDSSGQLYYIDISSQTNKVYTFAIQSLIGSAPGRVEIKSLQHTEPDFLLIRNGAARYIRLQAELPRGFSYALASNVAVAPNGDQTLLLQLENTQGSKKLQIRTIDLEESTENSIETDYNNVTGVSHIVAALCRGSACRVLFSSKDNSVSLLQLPAGKVLWTREEALSHIVATEFLELPVSELDASIEHEFDSVSGDTIGMLYHRLFSQARQLSVLLTGQQGTSNDGLVRDEFGLHKVIVVATNVGKLFALDSITGDIVWSQFFPNVEPFTLLGKRSMLLFVQRTARYAPLPGQCALLMRDKTNGNVIMYTFDPITGQAINELERLPYRIDQAMLLPYEDDEHLKGLLILSQDGQVHLYPSSSKLILLKHASSTFLYTANAEQGILRGFSLAHSTGENLKATPTWALSLGQAELITVGVRPFTERVHSQGRVLADRSVLYKYVNPNLLALATMIDDPIHKHVLSIYLVDGVTGLIVYSAVHKRAGKPVHLVHSENWLVYSYFNERFRRIELAAIELYEGAVQSNGTAFSSHAVSQLPHPETQAYIFPATPLTMQATITERGITNKHILVALSNGAVTEVPWAFLEPRGAQGVLNPEEGYIPYIPELPIPAEATINYNQSLGRVRGLQVAPARLESTCLVLVHGLDLFYTRVTPSKTFDLLKEDFDHWLIAVVLIGLTVASYVTKRLASRKALKQAWK